MKQRILVASLHAPWPPIFGDSVIAWNWIKQLAGQCSIVSAYFADGEASPPEALRSICAEALPLPGTRGHGALMGAPRRLRALVGKEPMALRDQDWTIAWARLQPLVARTGCQAAYLIHPRLLALSARLATSGLRVVAVPYDSMALALERQAAKEKSALRRHYLYDQSHRWTNFYQTHLKRCDAAVFVTKRDAEHTRSRIPDCRAPFHVIPNGVDVDFFDPAGIAPSADSERPYVVFTGNMHVPLTEDAVDHFLPIFRDLRANRPELHWYLVGKEPSEKILRIADEEPGVHVTGYVDDIRPYLAGAKAYVATIRSGAGIKNRVLEAMAMGCAVVATPMAVAGMGEPEQLPIKIASNRERLREAVEVLLDDAQEGKKLGARARRFVVRNHSWSRGADAALKLAFPTPGGT